jgi:hypothetical protein
MMALVFWSVKQNRHFWFDISVFFLLESNEQIHNLYPSPVIKIEGILMNKDEMGETRNTQGDKRSTYNPDAGDNLGDLGADLKIIQKFTLKKSGIKT